MASGNPYLRPSGVNSSFHAGHINFQDYIQHCQNIISIGRLDLNIPHPFTIVEANSPFEYRPSAMGKAKKGILFIHGLYDSPFTFRDLAQHIVKRDFLVRALLLPGHGTVPGDLLHMHYQEWLKAIAYTVNELANEVDEIYLGGFSLGGALAIYHALNDIRIKGLLLFAPALKARHYSANFVHGHLYVHWIGESMRWYQRIPQRNPVKYESYPCNAAYQACRMMRIARSSSAKKALNIPIFMTISQDDEAVNVSDALSFFVNQGNAASRLLLYTSSPESFADTRIATVNSAFPDQSILDFSHTCMLIAPTNLYLGTNGTYRDFQHYPGQKPKDSKQVYLGAITDKNINKYTMQRLSYNPDFSNMLTKLDEFLEKLKD